MPTSATQTSAPKPNRVVAVALAVLGIAGAVAPVVLNMDWQSTAGVIAGLGAAAVAAFKWLDGWQKHEANVAMYTGKVLGE